MKLDTAFTQYLSGFFSEAKKSDSESFSVEDMLEGRVGECMQQFDALCKITEGGMLQVFTSPSGPLLKNNEMFYRLLLSIWRHHLETGKPIMEAGILDELGDQDARAN